MKLIDFIPVGLAKYLNRSFGTNIVLGQKGPIWIDTTRPYELYTTIPQVKTVIDRKALMFANMWLKVVNVKTGEEFNDTQLEDLLQNPNPLQSQNDFLRQFKTQEQVYGNQFMFRNKVSAIAKYPQTLSNISPRYLQPVVSGKIFEQTKVEDIITSYLYDDNKGNKKTYETSEILYSRMNDLDHPVVGQSPFEALKYPVSNIKLAYQFRNVIMKEHGALGILSNKGGDSFGAMPLTDDEKTKIENQYRQTYGIGEDQRKFLLTEASLTWQAMTYPTKDMLLFEEVEADLLTIIDAFGMNVNMFSSKNATFENVRSSIIQTYQDTIMPEADQFTQAFGKFIGVPDGYRLEASYDHLSIMKEYKREGMKSLDALVKMLTQAIQSGLISGQQAEIILANELGVSLMDPENNDSKTLVRVNRMSPLVANKVLDQFTTNERRALGGQAAVTGGDTIPQPAAQSFNQPKE